MTTSGAPRLFANRTRHTRWLVVLLLPIVMMIVPPKRADSVADMMQTLGVVCLMVCMVGRVWCALYIAGRKSIELVALGPYSIVRNPLYIFSFIGVIGIGLISQVLTLLAIAMITFVVYHVVVVKSEEAVLSAIHDAAFARYMDSVPRWIPDFSKWRDAPSLEIEPRIVLHHLIDSSLFFLAFVFFEVMKMLRLANPYLPSVILP